MNMSEYPTLLGVMHELVLTPEIPASSNHRATRGKENESSPSLSHDLRVAAAHGPSSYSSCCGRPANRLDALI